MLEWGPSSLEKCKTTSYCFEQCVNSAEAEIYALSEAVKCGRLFQWRCEEMGMPIYGVANADMGG